ncbi:MAG: coenzyme F420-0:L-glutamate ligase [Dehalococcoidia bacterium]|nr:coenzyme F420-0:L-glutamate ligase [Dehalococcoidia bacterium]
MAGSYSVIGLGSLPELHPGDNLPSLVVDAVAAEAGGLHGGDVVVVTQKVVSKAEARLVDLRSVTPSAFALSLAAELDKDPALLEVILSETRRIVRMDHNVFIVETHHGFICANAGVDRSNVPDDQVVALLPVDPDASARAIRTKLTARWPEAACAVIITDSFGRPWREGITEVAIGVSGLLPVETMRGQRDPYGYLLSSTDIAIADHLAAAAGLVMGKFDMVPAAVVRGVRFTPAEGTAQALLRPAERDLFR